jgi:hypothetical protein
MNTTDITAAHVERIEQILHEAFSHDSTLFPFRRPCGHEDATTLERISAGELPDLDACPVCDGAYRLDRDDDGPALIYLDCRFCPACQEEARQAIEAQS